jgi:signal transduction histidine kinase
LRLLAPKSALIGRWDPTLLYHLVQSLLAHAIGRSPPGSTVLVVAADYGREAIVSVSDDAPLASYRHFLRPRAFDLPCEAFAAGRRIVEAHDGRIWAEAESRERGLTISFSLPYLQEDPPPAPTWRI